MSLTNILSSIVCDSFERNVGRGQINSTEPKALVLEFNSRINYEKEDGYRYRDLLIYAPQNYVGVYTRERWHTRANDPPDLVSERNSYSNANYQYTTGGTEWEVLSYHDSAWRTDGVDTFFRKHKESLESLSWVNPMLSGRVLTQEEIKELYDARVAQDTKRRAPKKR